LDVVKKNGWCAGQAKIADHAGLEVLLLFVFCSQGVTDVAKAGGASVLLAATIETAHSEPLLSGLCTQRWFGVLERLLLKPGGSQGSDPATHNIATHEKVAVVLQKLSKFPVARPFFDKGPIRRVLRNLLQMYADHVFLCLNLRSALANTDPHSPTQADGFDTAADTAQSPPG
jgi:hypothetical protein